MDKGGYYVMEVQGVRAWLKRINTLDKKLASKIKRTGCRIAANTVLPEAKKRTPRGTGALVKAIKVRSAKMKKRTSIGVNMMIGGQAWNMTDSFYGGHLEWGTHNKDGTWKIRPRRYLLAAFLAKKKAASRAALDYYRHEIENPANMR